MDFGVPATANYQAPSFTSTLQGLQGVQSNALNIQQQRQQLQVGANAAQAAQQTQQERQRITQMMQSGVDDKGNSIRDANGEPDVTKIMPAIGRMAPLTGQGYVQSLMDTHIAKAKLQTATTILSTAQRNALMGPIQSIATNPDDPDAVTNAAMQLDQWGKEHPEMGDLVNSAKTLLTHIQNAPTPDQKAKMANSIASGFQSGQAVQTQPQATSVDNGQQILVGTSAPPVAGGAFTPSSSVQKQLPPTTPTIGQGGQPGYLGPAGIGSNNPIQPGDTPAGVQAQIEAVRSNGGQPIRPQDQPAIDREVARLQQKLAGMQGGTPPGFVPSGLPPGQAQNISNNFDEMNRHFASLNDQSSGAQLVEGLTGNIKSLASGAATGTEAGRKAYVVGLLNALHLGNQATGDLQKDTDLLEKNMAQLNLATPASSDAARMLVSAARPHGTMSSGAITEAADQLTGQVKANMAMRNALQGYKMMGDVQGYANARQKLEQVADPRAWQYEALGPGSPAAKAFVDRLTPSDKADLGNKIQQLEQMGMFK